MRCDLEGGSVDVPEDRWYDPNHMWTKRASGVYIIGWTEFALQGAGDVSYLSLPKVGDTLVAGQDMGSVETGKWVGRLVSPVSGKVVDVNEDALRNPELVTRSPHEEGWLVRVEGEDGQEGDLLPAGEYLKILEKARE